MGAQQILQRPPAPVVVGDGREKLPVEYCMSLTSPLLSLSPPLYAVPMPCEQPLEAAGVQRGAALCDVGDDTIGRTREKVILEGGG